MKMSNGVRVLWILYFAGHSAAIMALKSSPPSQSSEAMKIHLMDQI